MVLSPCVESHSHRLTLSHTHTVCCVCFRTSSVCVSSVCVPAPGPRGVCFAFISLLHTTSQLSFLPHASHLLHLHRVAFASLHRHTHTQQHDDVCKALHTSHVTRPTSHAAPLHPAQTLPRCFATALKTRNHHTKHTHIPFPSLSQLLLRPRRKDHDRHSRPDSHAGQQARRPRRHHQAGAVPRARSKCTRRSSG